MEGKESLILLGKRGFKGWVCGSVIEWLPSTCEVLDLIPSTMKEQYNNNKKNEILKLRKLDRNGTPVWKKPQIMEYFSFSDCR